MSRPAAATLQLPRAAWRAASCQSGSADLPAERPVTAARQPAGPAHSAKHPCAIGPGRQPVINAAGAAYLRTAESSSNKSSDESARRNTIMQRAAESRNATQDTTCKAAAVSHGSRPTSESPLIHHSAGHGCSTRQHASRAMERGMQSFCQSVPSTDSDACPAGLAAEGGAGNATAVRGRTSPVHGQLVGGGARPMWGLHVIAVCDV